MGEPKAFASLSSGLLARKGAARPAMRPQGFGQGGSGLEDLGWNDMGFEPPKPAVAPVLDEDHDAFGEELSGQPLRNPLAALTPIASPVHDQQAEIAERFAAHDEDGEDEEGEYVDETAELYDPRAEDIAAVGATEQRPRDSYWVAFTIGDIVYTVDLQGPPESSVSQQQAQDVAGAYFERLNGSKH